LRARSPRPRARFAIFAGQAIQVSARVMLTAAVRM
jgi:hypothetical protein